MKLSELQVDPELAKGKAFDFGGVGADGKQARFIIGHAENARTKQTKLMRNAANQLPMGKSVPDNVAEKIAKRAMIGTVLVGWDNIDGEDDKPLEFNEENAMLILNTPACFAFIQMRSQELANFQREKEEVAKAETKSGAGVAVELQPAPGIPDGPAGSGDEGAGTGEPA